MAASTSKKTKNAGKTARPRLGRKWRALLLLLTLGALAAGAALTYHQARQVWFTANPRFALRNVRVQVQKEGYWNGRSRLLAEHAGLQPRQSLFALDCAKLRKTLEDIPCVERAEVIPRLPDTLELHLTERFPRAVLGNPRSPWVADADAVVIPRLESMAAKWQLPVITGLDDVPLRSGEAAKQLQPALDLIMATLGSSQNISIRTVSIADPESLVFWMLYRNQKYYRVVLPRKNKGLGFMLSALESAVIDARRFGDERSNFNLSYNGQVVVN